MRNSSHRRRATAGGRRLLMIGGALLILSVAIAAQGGGGNANNPIASLKGIAVPQPAGLERYVADRQLLVVLGKALFWDVQVGSDGHTACASCHFHAGADHRITNQIAGSGGVERGGASQHVIVDRRLSVSCLREPE